MPTQAMCIQDQKKEDPTPETHLQPPVRTLSHSFFFPLIVSDLKAAINSTAIPHSLIILMVMSPTGQQDLFF